MSSMREKEKRKTRTDKSLASTLQQVELRQEQEQLRSEAARTPAVHASTALQDAIGNQAVLDAISGAEQQGMVGQAAETLSMGIAGVDTQDRMPGTGSMAVMRAMLHAELRQRAGIDSPDPSLSARIAHRRGRPLPPAVRERMEQAFGHDFDHVRIHTDPEAARTARELEAHAFASEADIWFGPGEFQPDTPRGEHLLAHELGHVVQADQGRLRATGSGLQVSDPSDHSELEAETMARQAVARMAQAPDLGSAPARLPVDSTWAPLELNNRIEGDGKLAGAPAMAELDAPTSPRAQPSAPSARGQVQRKARKGGRGGKSPKGSGRKPTSRRPGTGQDQADAQLQPEDLASAIAGVIARVMPTEELSREDDADLPAAGREGPTKGKGPGRGSKTKAGRGEGEQPGAPGPNAAGEDEQLSPLERLEGVLQGAIPVPIPDDMDLLPEQLGKAFEALGEDTQDRIVGLAEDHMPQADELLEGVDIDALMRGAEAAEQILDDPGSAMDQGADAVLDMAMDRIGGIDPSIGALNLGDPSLYLDKALKTDGATPGLDRGTLAPGSSAPKQVGGAPGPRGDSALKGPAATPTPGTDAPAKDHPAKDHPAKDTAKKGDTSPATDSGTQPVSKDADAKAGKKSEDKKKKDDKGGDGKDVKPMSQKEIKAEIKRLEIKKSFRTIDSEILDLDLNTHQVDLGDKQQRVGKVQGKQQETSEQKEKRKALVSRKAKGGPGGPPKDGKLAFLDIIAARLPKQLTALQGKVDKIQKASTKVSADQTLVQEEITAIDEELKALYDKLKSGGGGNSGNPDVPKTCVNLLEDVKKKEEKEIKVQEKAKQEEKDITVALEALGNTISEQKGLVTDHDNELGAHRSELKVVEGKISAQKAKLDAQKAADATKGKAKGKATKGTTTTTSTASDTSTKELKTRKTELGKLVQGVEHKRRKAVAARDKALKTQEQKKLRLKEKQDEIKERDKQLVLIKKAVETLAKPTIHFNIISAGVGVKPRMAWLPAGARPWEEGDEDLSETDRQKKDEDWKKQSDEQRKKGLEERQKERDAQKLRAAELEVATGQKKPGQTGPTTGETLVRDPKKKETAEEEAKRKQLEQDNLMRQIALARDMAPDKRQALLTQLAKSQKPAPRNEAQVQQKIADLNTQFDTKMSAVATAVQGKFTGKIPAGKLEEVAKANPGVSVEDLRRYNEDLKRKEFQAKAAAYLGFDPKEPGAGLKAQDRLWALGKDRSMKPAAMLKHIQMLKPGAGIPADLAPYMAHVQAAKANDQEYKKEFTGGQAQQAWLEKQQKEASEKESKHQQNLKIAGNLGVQPLEVDSYVKTLMATTGVTELEARRQFLKKGPKGFDSSKDAPVPADLAKQLANIHRIPDAAKRQAALDAITAKLPPKAMLGALMRAGESGDGLVKGPVANEALRTQVTGIEALPADKQWEATPTCPT